MANTVIELRHSYVTGNVPSSLANGELAINTYDGKLFYRGGASNTIQTIERYQGPAGLNGEIQFNDSGVLGANAGLSFNKSTGVLTTSGQINGSTLKSTQSSGDEGGQLDLSTAATNQSLSGGSVAIDIYQNKLRIFETGGTNRGVYIDIANGASAGVGTDLLNPAATPDTVARAQANAAFITANAAFIAANNAANTNLTQNNSITAAFAAANSAGVYANGAFTAANNAINTNLTQNNSITAAFTAANSAGVYANGAFTRANNSLNANTGGTVTGTITATSFITTGSYGDIQGANVIYANTFVANTGGYFQFADGSKQYTANSGTANSFGRIYASNNTTFANATVSTDQVTFTGFNGIEVKANASTKTITFEATPGLQGLSVDYGLVIDPVVYSLDYGTL